MAWPGSRPAGLLARRRAGALAVAQLNAIAAPASSQDGKMSSAAPQYACSPVEEFDMQSKRHPVRVGTRSSATVESVVTADLFPQS
jgi:hypothetical protein